jgi:hypothetical protein
MLEEFDAGLEHDDRSRGREQQHRLGAFRKDDAADLPAPAHGERERGAPRLREHRLPARRAVTGSGRPGSGRGGRLRAAQLQPPSECSPPDRDRCREVHRPVLPGGPRDAAHAGVRDGGSARQRTTAVRLVCTPGRARDDRAAARRLAQRDLLRGAQGIGRPGRLRPVRHASACVRSPPGRVHRPHEHLGGLQPQRRRRRRLGRHLVRQQLRAPRRSRPALLPPRSAAFLAPLRREPPPLDLPDR